MKSHIYRQSLCGARRALCVTATAFLVGALSAQTPAPSSSSDTTRRNSSTPSSPSGSPGSSYNAPGSSSSTTPSSSAGSTYNSTSSTAGAIASPPAGEKLSWTDRRFVTKASDGGQAEVALAQLAADRASNPDVKSYAQKLLADHAAVNSELIGIASAKRVELDKDDGQDRAYRRLSKKSGAEFDREFIEHMVDEHENAIKMFEKASKDAKDADLRGFASKHVGHLREHLQQAQTLQQSAMPTGRMDSSSGSYVTPPTPISSTTPSSSTSPSSSSSSGSSGSSSSSATDRGGSPSNTEPSRDKAP
jgi:putative membrane protein